MKKVLCTIIVSGLLLSGCATGPDAKKLSPEQKQRMKQEIIQNQLPVWIKTYPYY